MSLAGREPNLIQHVAWKKIKIKKILKHPSSPPPLKIRNPTRNCRMCFRCLVIFLAGSLLSVRWWTRISNRAASITEPSQQQQPNNNHIVSRRVCLFLRTVLKVVQGPHMRLQQPLMRTQTQMGPLARYTRTVLYLRLSVWPKNLMDSARLWRTWWTGPQGPLMSRCGPLQLKIRRPPQGATLGNSAVKLHPQWLKHPQMPFIHGWL